MVRDFQVDPVAGGQLRFTAPSSGASATLSPGNPVTISPNGTAKVNATANAIAGSYRVTADTKGASASVAFALTNLQGAPTVSVTDAGGTYNGNAFPATATAVGVDGSADSEEAKAMPGRQAMRPGRPRLITRFSMFTAYPQNTRFIIAIMTTRNSTVMTPPARMKSGTR